MSSAYKSLENQIRLLQEQLDSLPDGKLVCSHYGKYSKWYQSNGHSKTYIPKKNRLLAKQLALKKYLSLQIQVLLQEQEAIRLYLDHHTSLSRKTEEFLSEDSEYSHLLADCFAPLSSELDDWMHAPYSHNPFHPEQLTRKCISGHLVRSKSEELISMFLFIHQIPFRYECALPLDHATYYPDFTILHPQTKQLFYWEHFGMMDYSDYSQKAFSKLQVYADHGIIPSINLITTYETKETPLHSELIEKIIKHYFL